VKEGLPGLVERREMAVLVRVDARARLLPAGEGGEAAGVIRPRAVRSSTFRMLTALQLLPDRRGENRCTRLVASRRRATLSIQPKQSAWSTASDQVMVGLPDALEWKTTPTSLAVSWLAASQARNSAGVSKNFVSMATRRILGPPPWALTTAMPALTSDAARLVRL